RAERAAAMFVPAEAFEYAHEDLLRHVLGLVRVAQGDQHVAVDAIEVAHVERAEGVAVALLERDDESRGVAIFSLLGRRLPAAEEAELAGVAPKPGRQGQPVDGPSGPP